MAGCHGNRPLSLVTKVTPKPSQFRSIATSHDSILARRLGGGGSARFHRDRNCGRSSGLVMVACIGGIDLADCGPGQSLTDQGGGKRRGGIVRAGDELRFSPRGNSTQKRPPTRAALSLRSEALRATALTTRTVALAGKPFEAGATLI